MKLTLYLEKVLFVMIDFERVQEMIGCGKVVLVDGEAKEELVLDQNFPMHCRIELSSEDGEYTFVWSIKQSDKNTIRLSLHCMDEDSKLGLIRVDYNAGHINPETADENLPECFRPYIAKHFKDNEHHVHMYVPGYRQMAWALPIADTKLKQQEINIESIDFDIISAINSFADVINLKTKLLVNPILL